MLPVFVEPGHGFNLGAEMESLKAELRGRLQRLVNTSESVSKSLFGSTFPEAENTFQLSAFVDTPWKIVFRFIERLLQSRKSFFHGIPTTGFVYALNTSFGFTQLPFR